MSRRLVCGPPRSFFCATELAVGKDYSVSQKFFPI